MNANSQLVIDTPDSRALVTRLGPLDWIWALAIVAGSLFAWSLYHDNMNIYEDIILGGTAAAVIGMGWGWQPIRQLVIITALLSIAGILLYDGNLARANDQFFLNYLLSSQAAIMWMSALFVMATAAYTINLLSGAVFVGKVASAMTWSAVVMGLTGMMVRWWESYLINPEIGHIPVSNLYEVFILFSLITALIYLYYEDRYNTRAMGAFVLVIISAAVAFLLWYTFDRGAHEIQPLVPALKSYWMKIHVPANFIGYGCFSIAAMLGTAFLLRASLVKRWPNSAIVSRMPSPELLDDVMYKLIALGFAFFTIATILGSLWAAEAWGGYWSWDPKETWALIVWLNYAAWLHLRMIKGWHGKLMAWWSVVGLFVTLFAFLGVNMFLSGLHSYGEL